MLLFQKKLTNLFFVTLSLPSAAMNFALAIQLTALSWIMSTQYNMDLHDIGIVWAAGPIAGLVAQPLVGFISDGVWFWGGRRRPFIMVGGTIAALMLLALPNMDLVAAYTGFLVDPLASLFAITPIMMVGILTALTLDLAINVSFNPTRALIADATPEGEPRTKGYTYHQTIGGAFGVAAAVISAVYGNFFLIYFGISFVFLMSLIPPMVIEEPRHIKDEPKPEAEAAAAPPSESKESNLAEFAKIFVANGATWLGIHTMYVFMIGFIYQQIMGLDVMAEGFEPTEEQGAVAGQINAIGVGVLQTVGFLLPALALGSITKRLGMVRTHIAAMIVAAVGYLGLVFLAHDPYTFYALLVLVGIAWGSMLSLPFAIMTQKVSKGSVGWFMGVFNMSIVIPQLIVSLVISKIVNDVADKDLVFWIGAVSLFVSAALWTTVKEPESAPEGEPVMAGGGH